MARPIKEPPILYDDDDAEHLEMMVHNVVPRSKVYPSIEIPSEELRG